LAKARLVHLVHTRRHRNHVRQPDSRGAKRFAAPRTHVANALLKDHVPTTASLTLPSRAATYSRKDRRLFGLYHYLLHTIRPSAACAACAACGTSASAVCCAASATLLRSTARPLGKLQAGTMCSGVFIVEDIKSRQADVRDFFLAKGDNWCCVLGRYSAYRTNGWLGCTTHERQGASDSEYRHGFRPTPSLRSSPRVRHRKSPI
jgi:hypothetical protein